MDGYMKRNPYWILVLVFMLLSILLFERCINHKSETKNEEASERFLTDYYDDGKVKSTFLYNEKLDGNGIYEYYYSNGVLRLKIPYVKRKKEGWAEQYDSLGRRISRVHYSNNDRIGPTFWYSENGELRSSSNWIGNKQYGEGFFYFPDSSVRKYYVKDFSGKVFYVLDCDNEGNLIKEEGTIFSYRAFIEPKEMDDNAEEVKPRPIEDEVFSITKGTEIIVTVITPAIMESRFYFIVKNRSSYIDTLKAEIKYNTAVFKTDFLTKGEYSILFKGELWKDNNLVKMDTLTKYITVK